MASTQIYTVFFHYEEKYIDILLPSPAHTHTLHTYGGYNSFPHSCRWDVVPRPKSEQLFFDYIWTFLNTSFEKYDYIYL